MTWCCFDGGVLASPISAYGCIYFERLSFRLMLGEKKCRTTDLTGFKNLEV